MRHALLALLVLLLAVAIMGVKAGAEPVSLACSHANVPAHSIAEAPTDRCFVGAAGYVALPYQVPLGRTLCIADVMLASKFAGPRASSFYLTDGTGVSKLLTIVSHYPQVHPRTLLPIPGGTVVRGWFSNQADQGEEYNMQVKVQAKLVEGGECGS